MRGLRQKIHEARPGGGRWGRLGALLVVVATASVTLAGTASAQTVPTNGFLQVCKEADPGSGVTGVFTFTVSGFGTITAPVGQCAGLLELPAGTVTVTEEAQPGFAVDGIRTFPADRLISADLDTATATATIVAGDASRQTIIFVKNRVENPGPGRLQICKEAGTSGVTGDFDFTVAGSPGPTVAVGSCSPAFDAPVGTVRVAETARPGIILDSVRTEPSGRLDGVNLAAGTADVQVVAGSTTRVTFRNVAAELGFIKVCKIAGPGVTVGTRFTFEFAGGFMTVDAGPAAQGGYCTIGSAYAIGTVLTVQEQALPGYEVTAIAVHPSDRLVGVPDIANRRVTITIGSGINEVHFTNATPSGTTTTTIRPPDTTTTTIRPPDTTTTSSTTTTTRPPATTTTTRPPATTTTTRPPATTTTTVRPSGCAFTPGYYMNHEEVVRRLLNGGTLAVGGKNLTAAQVDEVLHRSSTNYLDALDQQLIAAKLNQLGGASVPTAIATAIAAADALVAQQGGPLTGTATPDTTVRYRGVVYTASQLNDILDRYNNGNAAGGPGHCS